MRFAANKAPLREFVETVAAPEACVFTLTDDPGFGIDCKRIEVWRISPALRGARAGRACCG